MGFSFGGSACERTLSNLLWHHKVLWHHTIYWLWCHTLTVFDVLFALSKNQLAIIDFRLKLLLFLPAKLTDKFFRDCNDVLEMLLVIVRVGKPLLQFDNSLFSLDHSIELWHHM